MSDIVERAREEADLCRAETADDIAVLLDELADEITRLRALLNECHAELASNLSQIMNDYENIPPDGEGMVEAKLWIDRLTDILTRIDAAIGAER